MLKRKVIVGVVALAAVALAGGAYAATQDSSSPRQAFLNDVAKRLHVTPQQLQAALRGAYADRLQSLVAAGRLTQAQANKLEQRIARGQLPPFFGGRRFGPPRLGGPRELSAAASYLGLTDAQLLNQLGSGKSLAQIARGRGKSVSGLKSTMEAAIRTRLDRLVSRGVITNAQEQQILSRMSAMLGALINRTGFMPMRLHPGLVPGPGGPPGPGAIAVPVPPAGAAGEGLIASPPDGSAPPPPTGPSS